MSEFTPKSAPEIDLSPPPQGKVEEFLEQHIKKILVGVALLALVMLTIAISRHFKHKTEVEAAERFTAAPPSRIAMWWLPSIPVPQQQATPCCSRQICSGRKARRSLPQKY
ncbi:hypothetical protein [Verrucomicrobium spinosum]|uniref:hypothetical protein n=1 Tax=Verrucomicrobium spinosum TaxID=2736 RepID=UPI000AE19E67|nr:hypothetical protein [Verrucomicrobium spinosum]